MFKRIITMILVVVMCMGVFAGCASAGCKSEEGRPGIVGVEYLDKVMEIDERYDNGDVVFDYTVRMAQAEDYWIVYLEGEADEYYGYVAVGIYDHVPDEKEIDILWANRMLEDEIVNILEQYGC